MALAYKRRHCLLISITLLVVLQITAYYNIWQPSSGSLTSEWKPTQPFEIMGSYQKRREIRVPEPGFKRILFWNEAYGGKDYIIGRGNDVFQKARCPVWQCQTTDNRHSVPVEDFDAILFHLRSFDDKDLPARRKPHQRYVLWSIESPAYRYIHPAKLDSIFNWTMTYRWDSDVVQPYGWIQPIGDLPLHPSRDQLEPLIQKTRNSGKNYAEGKKKLVAWMVSNCDTPSARMKYVKKLQKYVDVDIYGVCGNLMCPRSREKHCRKMIEKNYKFYIAFENSLCTDYVTEKFFSTLQLDIVPLVLDIHNNTRKVAPPHSFINVARFGGVRKLAQYLKTLDKNDTLYNEYFWWKDFYKIRNSEEDQKLGMCELCAKLHENSPPKNSYENFTEWWEEKSQCKSLRFY